MMDRNKKDELPKLQVGFIDFVCTFVYKVSVLDVHCCDKVSEKINLGCSESELHGRELTDSVTSHFIVQEGRGREGWGENTPFKDTPHGLLPPTRVLILKFLAPPYSHESINEINPP